MSRDVPIARIEDGEIHVEHPNLMPLYLQKTGNLDLWLTMRAIDRHRTNSRLLKKALRLKQRDDVSTVLHFQAVTITDAWWIKADDEDLDYEDVCFHRNYFDKLALRGDADSFNLPPSRTPELTNTGSFEKCWRLENGQWWLYKAENAEERFTEVFSSHLAKALGLDAVHYEVQDACVRCLDFTGSAQVNLDPAVGLIGECSDYVEMFDALAAAGSEVQRAFVDMCYFDALLFNMDRHEYNFGVLRDVDSGQTLRLAPLYDHNIALITRGYPRDIERTHDRLIADFLELLKERPTGFRMRELARDAVLDAVAATKVPLKRPNQLPMEPEEYVSGFILNGQKRIEEALT